VRWLTDPPTTSYEVVSSNRHHLRLEGPTASTRVAGGVMVGIGTVFAGVGASFLRMPFPPLAKLVPLAFVVTGTGLALAGGADLISSCSIDVRKTGLMFRLTARPLPERSFEVPAAQIEALEVTDEAQSDRNGLTTVSYTLCLVKRDGTMLRLETFPTRAQANLRKQALEKVL
jgi:hypothetical protein